MSPSLADPGAVSKLTYYYRGLMSELGIKRIGDLLENPIEPDVWKGSRSSGEQGGLFALWWGLGYNADHTASGAVLVRVLPSAIGQ
jgi:hypothetical protein